MIVGVIYLITNLLNGKKYVGKTTQTLKRRINQHKHGNIHIDKAIQKYGRENFKVEVLEECYTVEQLNEREIFWIAALNTKVPNGYNITDGGEGNLGLSHTKETRDQMSIDRSGEKNAFFGKNHTDDTCFTLSVSHRKETPYENLRNEMDAVQMTIASLAKLLELTPATLSGKMRGKYNFTAKDKAKLEKIFNKPIDYLLKRNDGLPTIIIESTAGENNPFFGKHHTGENLTKLSEMNRGDSPYKNLLKEMDAIHLTYIALAKLLGLTQPTLSEKMHGKINFTAKDRAKLEKIFGKPAEYLLYSDEPIAPLQKKYNRILYKNLFREMEARQMTQTNLGKILGLAKTTISAKMLGKLNFTAKDKIKLEEIFKKPIGYLLRRADG